MTWQLSVLYALTFGGFVAFSVYLPTYLKNAFGLEPSDASLRTAGFIVLAVVARPVGGWLCDRLPAVHVLGACCLLAGLFAGRGRTAPAPDWHDRLPLLGAGAGAVFALVANVAPADKVGSVTGVVGAAGGLGGFFPPLVMGSVYGATGDYTAGLALLGATALACALLVRSSLRPKTAESAAGVSGS